jgi:hypothetical protein
VAKRDHGLEFDHHWETSYTSCNTIFNGLLKQEPTIEKQWPLKKLLIAANQDIFFLALDEIGCFNLKTIANEKSDAQVGRVNTFHILQTIRKRPFTFRFCTEGPLRFPNF